jgi:hypothetical protein
MDSLNWPVLIPGIFGPHECFHMAVLLGVSLHWVFVWRFASAAIGGQGNPLQRLPGDEGQVISGRVRPGHG